MMSLDDATKVLGVIGGIAGPAGLVISVLNYRRDAARIKVRLTRGRRVLNPDGNDAVRSALKNYALMGQVPPMDLFIRDPDKLWGYIEVSNHGRRTAEIVAVGWVAADGGSALPSGYLNDRNWLPATLAEAQARDFPIADTEFDKYGVLAVFARDSLNRSHYGSFTRSWGGFKLRARILLRRTHIRHHAGTASR